MLVYFNEQKISTLSTVAVMADECMLTHKVVFPSGASQEKSCTTSVPLSGMGQEMGVRTEEHVCMF